MQVQTFNRFQIQNRVIMKTVFSMIFAASVLASQSAHAGTPIINLSVGGEISPGVYGQVQFGNGPPPPVLYAQPRIIVRQPPNVVLEPIYLHVPPGHARNWSRHCHEYNACNRPVYFVRSAEYEPGYRSHRDVRHREEGRSDEHRRDEGRGDEHRGRDKGYEGERGRGEGRRD